MQQTRQVINKPRQNYWRRLGIEIWKNRGIYLLMILPVIWYAVFCYGPMGGLTLAFKKYSGKLGIWGSQWTGWKNFETVFRDPYFFRAVQSTLEINIVMLFLCFPMPIVVALLLNEIRMKRYKKVVQTVLTFPHFLSWVIVGSIIKMMFSSDGPVNDVILSLGGEKIIFMGTKELFRPIIIISSIWKEAGWGSIVYLAAITGIDQQQYEAAEIDGANRWQRMWYITLPSIFPTIAVMLILEMGNIMGGHFDQIFNLRNDVILSAAETLAMFTYRVTFERMPNYGYSTAVSLFSSLINMVLLVGTNTLSMRFGGGGLMGEGRKKK